MTLDAYYHNRAITCVFQIFLLQIWSMCDTLTQSLSFSFHTSTHTNTVNPRLCVTVSFGPSGFAAVQPLLHSSLYITRFAHFATKIIIVVIIFIIFLIVRVSNITIKLDQICHLAPFGDSSPPGGTHTQASLLTRAWWRIITAALLKSPAPSKGKACLSLMGAIMGLSDGGRVTLSGQAECTSFRPGRSGWHRGLGCIPHVWGLAPPAAIPVPLCSQSH